MRLVVFVLSLALGSGVPVAPAAWADGDAKAGERVFNQCRACHSLEAGKNMVGPSLAGVFGRKAATAPGFNFSAAMRESGIIWNEKTLDQFLADPRRFTPGNKMAFIGLRVAQQREDMIAYLEHAAKSR